MYISKLVNGKNFYKYPDSETASRIVKNALNHTTGTSQNITVPKNIKKINSHNSFDSNVLPQKMSLFYISKILLIKKFNKTEKQKLIQIAKQLIQNSIEKNNYQ